jgi:DNA-binding response OmpR family regulator
VILEGEGYEVVCAGDGEEGLRVANRTRHDAILLDLKMPVMDGTEFARRYRASGGGKPIVVITAAREPEEKAAEMDPCAYLAKPFELQSLIESIRACTQGGLSPSGRPS